MPQFLYLLRLKCKIWTKTKSSFLATSLYKKVIFTKNWVTRSCCPSDDMCFHTNYIYTYFVVLFSSLLHAAGLKRMAKGGAIGLSLASMWCLYQNRDKLKSMMDNKQYWNALEICHSSLAHNGQFMRKRGNSKDFLYIYLYLHMCCHGCVYICSCHVLDDDTKLLTNTMGVRLTCLWSTLPYTKIFIFTMMWMPLYS